MWNMEPLRSFYRNCYYIKYIFACALPKQYSDKKCLVGRQGCVKVFIAAKLFVYKFRLDIPLALSNRKSIDTKLNINVPHIVGTDRKRCAERIRRPGSAIERLHRRRRRPGTAGGSTAVGTPSWSSEQYSNDDINYFWRMKRFTFFSN